MMDREKILYKDEGYQIYGAIFEVYKVMGSGFLEAVYQECLEREFLLRKIPFEPQKKLTLSYKDKPLSQIFSVDFLCYDKIVVELKAVKKILPEHQAQTLNFIKASNFKLGLLVNFGAHPKIEMQRLVNHMLQ